MAYGRHWEWRGFGRLADGTRQRLLQLPSPFSSVDIVTDDYLWVPGRAINLKLRDRGHGALKLKRLERRDAETGLELWLERPDEEYPFPLQPNILRMLGRELAIAVPSTATPLDRGPLLALLAKATPPIRLISVKKRRDTRVFADPQGDVLIDIADITEPERVVSVGIEDAHELTSEAPSERFARARLAVSHAVAHFALTTNLHAMNYLQALERWGLHQSVLTKP